MHNPGWSGFYDVDHTGLKPRDPCVSALGAGIKGVLLHSVTCFY